MSLTFPTGRKTYGGEPASPGEPERASHCQCEPRPLLVTGQDTCLQCGRYPKDTISETWSERARAVAAKRAKQAA